MQESELIRNLYANSGFSIFLGAGASLGSGIPTASSLVWYFKREIYCSDTHFSKENYKDLQSTFVQAKIQEYMDNNENYCINDKSKEYSFYFEKCFSSIEARQKFISNLMEGRNPSLGYLCLAELIKNRYFKNIWTTNFDNLIKTSMNIISPELTINEYGISNINREIIDNDFPSIWKLHGDYRYDYLKNTCDELQNLEGLLSDQFVKQLENNGLIVIGYAGNDNSIMSLLEENADNKKFLSKGLFWLTHDNNRTNDRVKKLIETYKKEGKTAELIRIDGFDEFMHNFYMMTDIRNEKIDKKYAMNISSKNIEFAKNNSNFIKLNGYQCINLPKCNRFKIDITSWKELRDKIFDKNIICALYNGYIYSFNTKDELKKAFDVNIKGQVEECDSSNIISECSNIYIGMLYDLIRYCMAELGYGRHGKNKYYSNTLFHVENNAKVYEAIKIDIIYEDNIYLLLQPTKHVTKINGDNLDKEQYVKVINSIMSVIYNRNYLKLLQEWENRFRFLKTNYIQFRYKDMCIQFLLPSLSCGGTKNRKEWVKKHATRFPEPIMRFSVDDFTKCGINQLQGVKRYGPLDSTIIQRESDEFKLAILSPKEGINALVRFLNNLNEVSTESNDQFLPDFNGFDLITKCNLIIPAKNSELLTEYVKASEWNDYPQKYLQFMKDQINKFALIRERFDLLIIYIPNTYSSFRNNSDIYEDFDLHDELKLYAMKKNIPVQFIESRSLTGDMQKIKWCLTMALYTKGKAGIPWQPKDVFEESAYIGISYAISKERGVCIGCSQLFDSAGNGMRMILRKIKDKINLKRKNPYMSSDEMRNMMSALRNEYCKCFPNKKLSRIVIHKNTEFKREEIIGILQAFEGIEDIEMIQIQYSSWRGIRYKNEIKDGGAPYPQFRGTAIQLSNDAFLLWTHGSINNDELGCQTYYKGGRGIPSPLYIKRFYGNCDADILAKEILMLTKMNFNSGDSLYKTMPVTIDFAQIIARMSKQKENILNVSYDFRYFM